MQKSKKLLAVILSLVMLLAVVPFTALATDEADAADEAIAIAEARVAGWEANYALFLENIFDNQQHLGWNYTYSNSKSIQNKMTTYTVFNLYSDAWKNGLDGSVSLATAEKVLLALIDQVQADVKESKVEEIVKILDAAQDVNSFLKKVNDFVEISDKIGGQTWNSVFSALGHAKDLANIWLEQRAELVDAYARILTVKESNDLYIEFLQYIVNNGKYDVLVQAAAKLLSEIEANMDDLVAKIMADAAGEVAFNVVEYAASIAADTNVYTAAAKKIWNIGGDISDFLWNTRDQYAILDSMYTTFFAEVAAQEWATEIMAGTDAEKKVFAVNALLSLRESSTRLVYNLKVADAQGIIGRIKDKINSTITGDYTVELLAIDIMRQQMFDADPATYVPVTSMFSIYCPVNVVATAADETALYTFEDGFEEIRANEYGIFGGKYSQYSKDYLKVACLYGDEALKLVGTADGKVTLVMDKLGADGIIDFSFTEQTVAAGTEIFVPTAFDGTPSYKLINGDSAITIAMNDEFVAPEEVPVNTETVTDAVKEVVKEETKSFLDKIREFFKNFFAIFTKIFKKK